MKVKVSCCLQFYIVTGGFDNRLKRLASTEILRKNGGTSWSTVASLPTPRNGITGVSLPDGHFLVSGEDISHLQSIQLMIHHYRRCWWWQQADGSVALWSGGWPVDPRGPARHRPRRPRHESCCSDRVLLSLFHAQLQIIIHAEFPRRQQQSSNSKWCIFCINFI